MHEKNNLMNWTESPLGQALHDEGGQLLARIRPLSAGGVSAQWCNGQTWDVSDQHTKLGRSPARWFATVPEARKAIESALEAPQAGDPGWTGGGEAGIARVPGLVQQLYALVKEFETLFPGRKFTPDGHLVWSIGEVIAAHGFGLRLLDGDSGAHDALAPDGRLVQVKATQGRGITLRSEPEHLLVLQLRRDGGHELVYNGPGEPVWASATAKPGGAQRTISLVKLLRLMQAVPAEQQLAAPVSG